MGIQSQKLGIPVKLTNRICWEYTTQELKEYTTQELWEYTTQELKEYTTQELWEYKTQELKEYTTNRRQWAQRVWLCHSEGFARKFCKQIFEVWMK